MPLLPPANGTDGCRCLTVLSYRSALVFGGGHVVLPLLQAEVIPRGWLDNGAFPGGYGIAAAFRSPLFSFAAYLGAAKSGSPNGWLAGLWCLFAILLPPILLVTGLLPLWNRLRASAAARSLLAGPMQQSLESVGSALSAYLDKRNRFSEELGARPHPVCWFADLEDSAMDPRPDRAVMGGIFCDNVCEPKKSPSKFQVYGQNAFQLAEYRRPCGNAFGPATSRIGFLCRRDQEIHVSHRVGYRSIRKDRHHLSTFIRAVCWRRGDCLRTSADLWTLYPASGLAIAD